LIEIGFADWAQTGLLKNSKKKHDKTNINVLWDLVATVRFIY
jgi:hypothetical protein